MSRAFCPYNQLCIETILYTDIYKVHGMLTENVRRTCIGAGKCQERQRRKILIINKFSREMFTHFAEKFCHGVFASRNQCAVQKFKIY